jgi:hypothetical protein
LDPSREVFSVAEFDHILRRRKQRYLLDSVCVMYASTGEELAVYKGVIDEVSFKDLNAITIAGGAKSNFSWYFVRDAEVAVSFDLKPGVIYRFRDPRGLFDCTIPKQLYNTPENIRSYVQEELETSYNVNGHTFQRKMGILRDQYYLT